MDFRSFRPDRCADCVKVQISLLHLYHPSYIMAKRRKNRTHTKGANAEVEEDKGPKSFVIKVRVSASATHLLCSPSCSSVGRSHKERLSARQGHAKGHGARDRQSTESKPSRLYKFIPHLHLVGRNEEQLDYVITWSWLVP